MFTLAIYDQVSGQDLKAGRKIAGTGTIEKDGSVGDIGGAYLKVKSAADSGADIFFVPNKSSNQGNEKGWSGCQNQLSRGQGSCQETGNQDENRPC